MIMRFYVNGNKLLTLSIHDKDTVPRIGESIMKNGIKYKIVDIIWEESMYPYATVLLEQKEK